MSQRRRPFAALALLPMIFLAAAPATAVAEQEQPLIDLLKSDAPPQEKALACKKLAIWGSGEAVPSLAALLPDPELSSWARIALEAIPDSAVDEALRNAMEALDGRVLIGVINSIGVRRDPQAVDGLTRRLNSSNASIASAAAAALGRIGNETALASLRPALKTGDAYVRSAVAEACILCAEQLLAGHHAEEAAALYNEIRTADVPSQRILEATRGVILARGADGIPLLVEQLKSTDEEMLFIGLMTARELKGRGVSQKLLATMDELSEDRQALLVLAMAERQDPEAVPALLQAAEHAPPTVRAAAIKVLSSLGDVSCVPLLLQIASEEDPQLVQAAMATLAALPGPGVDDDLAARLAGAKGAERLALIQLIGSRRIDALPPLLEAVDDVNANVRSAALQSLGEVATLNELSLLIERTLNPPHAEDAPIALKALHAACVRMPQREACAEKLAAAMPDAPVEAKLAMLETLSAMGGSNALKAVGAAATSGDSRLQDAATRLLGSWMTVDAGPVLLDLATTPDSPYQVRALRGYIRLARQFIMSDQQRAAMSRKALSAAQRDAERKLVLEVVRRYPSVDMLRLAVDATEYPGVHDVAASAALAVAAKLGESDDVMELLRQMQHDPVEVEIIQATYGQGDRRQDVTDILQSLARDLPVITMPAENYNATLKGDPAPGVPKELNLRFKIDGRPGEATFPENTKILILTPTK